MILIMMVIMIMIIVTRGRGAEMFRIKEWREGGASARLNIMFKKKHRACILCLVGGIIFNILEVEDQYFICVSVFF